MDFVKKRIEFSHMFFEQERFVLVQAISNQKQDPAHTYQKDDCIRIEDEKTCMTRSLESPLDIVSSK